MLTYLKYLDLFGTNYKFTIDNQDRFKTSIGSLLTIISIGIIVYFSFLLGKDFFFRENPNLLTNIDTPRNYADSFKLSNEDLFIIWRIEDSSQSGTNFEGYIYPIFEYFSARRNNKTGENDIIFSKTITSSRCDKINAKVPEFYGNFNSSQWYCLDWNSGNFEFGGYWDATFVDYFRIQIHYCNYQGNCTKSDTLRKFFNQTKYISFLLPSISIDPLEKEVSPLKLNFKNYFYGLNLESYKLDRNYFRKVSLSDDEGWLVDSFKTFEKYTFQETQSDFYNFHYDANINNKEKYIYKGVFYMQKQINLYTRKYVKAIDFAARLNVLMKVVFFILSIFYIPFNDYVRNNYFFNKIFEFKYKSNNNEEDNISYKIEKSTDRIKQGFSEMDKKDLKKKSNVRIEEIEKFLDKPKTHTLQFTFIDTFLTKTCKNLINKKKKNIMIAYDKISSYVKTRLDFLSYIKSMQKLEILKSLLLNQEQNICFDFFKRMNIAEKEEMNVINVELVKETAQDALTIVNYFNQNKNNTLNNRDLQIYNLLDDSVKNFIGKFDINTTAFEKDISLPIINKIDQKKIKFFKKK